MNKHAPPVTTIIFADGPRWHSENLLKTYQQWQARIRSDVPMSSERKQQLLKADILLPALLQHMKNKGWR